MGLGCEGGIIAREGNEFQFSRGLAKDHVQCRRKLEMSSAAQSRNDTATAATAVRILEIRAQGFYHGRAVAESANYVRAIEMLDADRLGSPAKSTLPSSVPPCPSGTEAANACCTVA